MHAQNFKNRNRRGPSWTGQRLHERKRGICNFWPLQNVEIPPRSRRSTNSPQTRSSSGTANDAEQRGCRRCSAGVVSTAFIHLKSFNGDSRFSTWLSRIAINAALMKLRKKHRLWMRHWMNRPKTEEPSARIEVEDQGPNSRTALRPTGTATNSFRAMNELTPGMRKSNRAA